MKEAKCDLCDGEGKLSLLSKCHSTAPLLATLEGDTLILRCYIPECLREVARFGIGEDSEVYRLKAAIKHLLDETMRQRPIEEYRWVKLMLGDVAKDERPSCS